LPHWKAVKRQRLRSGQMLFKSSSKAAFKQNYLAELHADKPKKQALAIAYDIKRKAGGKAPKKRS
jgi:hypothetical protein